MLTGLSLSELGERFRRREVTPTEAALAYLERIDALDVDGVEPTSHAVPLTNIMRDDEPRPSFPRDEMLANAPDPHGDFFRVPKIIED